MIQPKIAIIDADYIIYKVCYITNEESSVKLLVGNIIKTLLNEVKCTHYVAVLTKSNFRTKINSSYKANRPDKPLLHKAVFDCIINDYNGFYEDLLEADDVCAILHTRLGDMSLLISPDKDLRTVTGLIYDPNKKQYHVVDDLGYLRLSDDRKKLLGCGLKLFYAQMIMGDMTDGVKGLPKLGLIASYNLLNELDSIQDLHSTVFNKYIEIYGNNARIEFMTNFNMLWIIRYNPELKTPQFVAI
jgi:5'-3' exonuclease